MHPATSDKSSEGRLTSRSAGQVEARLALPTRAMLLSVLAPPLVISVAWCIAALLGALPAATVSGIIGAAAVAVVAGAGVLIMTPWRPRPVADWMTTWLAATVFRLLVTPVLVYLLYSAASPGLAVKPLVLSVASAYFVTLLTEAVILSSHIRRTLPSA